MYTKIQINDSNQLALTFLWLCHDQQFASLD